MKGCFCVFRSLEDEDATYCRYVAGRTSIERRLYPACKATAASKTDLVHRRLAPGTGMHEWLRMPVGSDLFPIQISCFPQ